MGPSTFGFNSRSSPPQKNERIGQILRLNRRDIAGMSLRQHQPLNAAGLAGLLIAIDHYSAQPCIPRGRLEPYWHPVQELAHHQFLLFTPITPSYGPVMPTSVT